MHDLTASQRAFVKGAGFDMRSTTPLKGDLSARRFFRIDNGAQSAILMILADDETETLGRVEDVTGRLEAAGLSVPRLMATDQATGLALIEDFGNTHMADLLRSGEPAGPLFDLTLDALELVRGANSDGLIAPSPSELAGWLDLIDDWIPGCDRIAASELRACLAEKLAEIDATPRCLSLRDAHAENVIWLSDRAGVRKLGLIDFQDALLMHPLYDVASFLRDARIDIDETLVDAMLTKAAAQLGVGLDAARHAFDLLTFQRNLRIAAVFHRSAKRDNKTSHLAHLGRVLGHVRRASENPQLGDLSRLLPRVVPEVAVRA